MSYKCNIYTLSNRKPSALEIAKKNLIISEDSTDTDDTVARECFNNIEKVYDYFDKHFNRQALNNLDKAFEIYIHAYKKSGKAKYYHTNKRDYFLFGDGDQKSYERPSAYVDILAHEITHGYLNYLCPIEYKLNDTGAIIEHLCDVFGILIRKETSDDQSWILGKDYVIKHDGVRDLANPGNDLVMIKMKVHLSEKVKYKQHKSIYVNSGILSNVFCNLYESVTNKEILINIWYQTLQNLPRKCEFDDFAETAISTSEIIDNDISKNIKNQFEQAGINL